MNATLPPLLLLILALAAPVQAGPPYVPETEQVPSIPVTAPVATTAIPTTAAPSQSISVNSSNTKGIKIKPPKRSARKKPNTTPERGHTDKAAIEHQVKESTQRPATSLSVESKTVYNYTPDALYLIYAAVGHVVDVQLQPGETIPSKIVAGDTYRWEVGTVQEGTGANAVIHVLIKPKQAGIETNFLIATDRHAYRLYAQAYDDFFIPAVGWNYPDEEQAKAIQVKKEQQRQEKLVAVPGIIAADLNFKYKIKPDGRYRWTPVRVFDDHSKTYIQMSPDMKSSEAPVFFIQDGGKLNLVNYRIRGDYFIVDRLFDVGELRSGKKDKVRIINEQTKPAAEDIEHGKGWTGTD